MLAANRGAALAAAVRMVVRVHRYAAVLRANTEPAVTASLTDRDVLVFEIADLADRGAAIDVHLAELTRRHAEECIIAFLSHELCGRTSTADELCALADLELDIVYRRADRDVLERECVADLDISVRAGNDLIADLEAVRCEDVALLAVNVVEQSDAGAAVRIVLTRAGIPSFVRLKSITR